MADTNYISSIVKIIENPVTKVLDDKTLVTELRAQLPQIRNTRIVNLIFWGNLARDFANYYKVNDYIIIEGYLSLRNKESTNKNIFFTVLKVYLIKY